MSDHRRLWIKNSVGESWDLNEPTDNQFVFGNNPEGLGAQANMSVMRIGDSQLLSSYYWELKPIHIEMLFLPQNTNADVYKTYEEFFDFLSRRPLELHYQTPNNDYSFYKPVTLSNIEKGEIDEATGILHSPLELIPHTMWVSSNEVVVEVLPSGGTSKTYELERPYHYVLDSFANVSLYSKSTVDIPFIIEIEGIVSNPRYDLFDANNTKYGSGRLEGSFDYVYVNSTDLEEDIKLSNKGAFLPNTSSYQDLTVGSAGSVMVTFLKLKPGQNYIRFTFDNVFDGKIIMRWRNYRVS